jgi:N-methylhydantoinase A
LARDALAALGARLGISATEVAAAGLDAATATTYAALLPLLAGHGVDQRDFALMAFGGAGPTHAFLLAREAGFDRVVVPPAPGALCALGCVLADFRADFVRTVYSNYDEAQVLLGAAYEQLDAEAGAWLDRERIESRDRLMMRSADVRYYGQSYELTVPLPDGSAQSAVDGLREAFEHMYERVYGYTQAGASLEVVNVRVQAVGLSRKPAWQPATPRLLGGPEPIARRAVLYGGEPDGVPVYRRDGLRVGDCVPGPAIITQYDTTVFVPSGFQVTVDRLLNLLGESVS